MRAPILFALPALFGCVKYVPPAPAVARPATVVAAPFDRAWNSVIDVFAEEVITVETVERASGFIVASRSAIPQATKADSTYAISLADCGRAAVTYLINTPPGDYLPTSAKYNVVVRSSEGGSSVRVTAKFIRASRGETIECSSKGAFEARFERLVKERAEKTAP